MNALWIKICGMKTREAIEAAAASGADAVGFVFHAPSPRNLSLEEARALQAAVPRSLERVAVFLHPSQAHVDAVIAGIAPDWVQLDIGDLEHLRLPADQRVLPVIRGDAPLPSPAPARCLVEGARSGTGERCDWSVAARMARLTQLVLAGGLDAGNVGEAIRTVRPFGVDVSSGVESRRGIKDAALIREFIRATRAVAFPDQVEEERG